MCRAEEQIQKQPNRKKPRTLRSCEKTNNLTQRREDAKAQRLAKNGCFVFFAPCTTWRLCVKCFCSSRDYFTASCAVGYDLPPASRAGAKNRGPATQATFASDTTDNLTTPRPPPEPGGEYFGQLDALPKKISSCCQEKVMTACLNSYPVGRTADLQNRSALLRGVCTLALCLTPVITVCTLVT